MARFTAMPPPSDAMYWDGSGESQAAIVTWAKGEVSGWFDGTYFLKCESSEGLSRAEAGDWVVRDSTGFYACKVADPVPADEVELGDEPSMGPLSRQRVTVNVRSRRQASPPADEGGE